MIIYKDLKTTNQLINHLKINKEVTFNDINENLASNILYEHNYLNVISPFKNILGRNNNVDFSKYYELYINERKDYSIIFKNISIIESKLNSIISYEVILGYNITNSNIFKLFVNSPIN